MPEASLPLTSGRPTLVIEGQVVADLGAALMAFEVRERIDGLAQAQLAFGNWGTHAGAPGYTLFERDRLEFGKALQIKLGEDLLFSGRVMALQARFPEGGAGEAELLVQVEDRLQDLRMKRRTRSFERASLAAVAQRMASDHGLTASVDAESPTLPLLAQVNQSDLAFLRELARRCEAEVWLDGTTLHVAARKRRGGAPLSLDYGGRLLSFDVRADLALQRTELSVAGWSVADKRPIRETVNAGSLLGGETSDGEGGAALLQSKIGARPDTVAHLQPGSADEARQLAEAWLRQINRRFVTGHGTAQPDARLRCGATVALTGLGPLFSGAYALAEVCHRFDMAAGLRTEFVAERPWIGRPA
ncbi:phage late control D family protein [Roseateles sp. BYS96W]|uniref:Phage late control D family protein n=1 Tax=Pelomonas nitida TaxID=3299027 RepID=A0ABW7G7A0_9BURK